MKQIILITDVTINAKVEEEGSIFTVGSALFNKLVNEDKVAQLYIKPRKSKAKKEK